MKILITILGFLNGSYMLLDGIFVMIKGKYIGPEKPGPWASLLSFTGVDVFKLGPMFVGFGVAWLVFAFGLFSGSAWAYWWGMIVAVLTFWYLPFGTIISLIVLAALIFFRERLFAV